MNIFDFSINFDFNKIKTITNEAQLFVKTCNCLFLKVEFTKLAVEICFLEKQHELIVNDSILYKIGNFVTGVEIFLSQISKLHNFSYFNCLSEVKIKFIKITEEFECVISQFSDYFLLKDRKNAELQIVEDEIIETEKVSDLSKIL